VDARSHPLIVDLDRTLLATDTLAESWLLLLSRSPLLALLAMLKLFKGRIAFKRYLAWHTKLDINLLPRNEAFYDWMMDQKSRLQRPLHLVTAADQSIADQVQAAFPEFDTATGTSGDINLKGSNKASYLAERFPEGFTYAGDSSADLQVWKQAQGAVLVGVSAPVRRQAEALDCTIEKAFPGNDAPLKTWAKAIRLHQWSKNVLVFAALFLSHSYFSPLAWMQILAGFVLMGIAASGTYLANDLLDLEADRAHATKKERPFAAGRLKVEQGVIASVLMIGLGTLGMMLITLPAALMLACYLALTLTYSFGLKRVALLDVVALACLFSLRIGLGAALISVAVSEWLLVFSMMFFFSLSLAKRQTELERQHARGEEEIKGRGYRASDRFLSLALGTAAAAVSILILCLYVMDAAYPSGLYPAPQFLWCLPAFVGVWVLRIWLLASRGDLHDDPVAFALKDRTSIGLFGSIGIGFFLATFGPAAS